MRPRHDERMHGPGAGRERIRCFVAVDLASEVVATVAAVTAELRRAGGDVRWVGEENLHVTLKFLGELSPDRLGAVRAAVGAAARATAPFAVAAAGLGAFPTPERARVAWVGLEGPALGRLAGRVDEALAGAGFPREERAFVPHVTIGRVRSPRGWSRVLAAMRPHWGAAFGVSRITEVLLYRSDLGPAGARYVPLERLALGTGGAGGADTSAETG
jgi:2'-5' RNA ligase